MRLKRRLGIVAAVLLAVVAVGWWLRPRQRWNVLFITLDTTRADHLRCYKYAKAETPALDSIASEGVLFEQAYAPVPLTLPSHATMFTGLYPPEHGLRVNGREALPTDIPTLASILSEQGYATGAFVSAFPLDRKFGLNRGFKVYNDELTDVKLDRGRQLRDAQSVTKAALDWMRQNADSPFLCWVHYYDPHHPYLDHADEFGSRFKSDPYDAEIAFVDRHVKKLRDFLDEQGLLENTLIVVVGDHGEGLGEHQERRHGNMVYGSTLHVPLLFRLPHSEVKNRRVTGTVSLVDLLPTVLEVMGQSPVEQTSGVSLASQLRDPKSEAASAPPDRTLYAESMEPLVFRGWSPLECVIHGNWKYIRTKQPELFDLQKDAGEQKNLADMEKSRATEMEERLIALKRPFVEHKAKLAQLSSVDIGKMQEIGYATGVKGAAAGRDVKEMIVFANMTEDAEALADSDPKQAEKLARQVLDADPTFDAALIALGQALENQNKIEEAQKHYLKALEIDPGAYMANFHLGNICLLKQDIPQAIARFELALKYRPDASNIHANLGNALLMKGRADLAIPHLQAAVDLHPGNMSARLSLARGLTQVGQIDAAIAEVEAVLKLDPDSADAHGELGLLLFRKRRNDDAFGHLRRSLLLNPRNALMHYNLAVALESIDRIEEAVLEYQRALALNPQDETTKKSLENAREVLEKRKR